MAPTLLLSALAAIALLSAASAAAQTGNAFAHGPKAGAKASKGVPKLKPVAQLRGAKAQSAPNRAKGRANSQGPAHASPRALERANQHSVLSSNRIVDGPLTGLGIGDPVHVNGVRVGVVERIIAAPEQKVGTVMVRTMSGRILRIPPQDLERENGRWSADGLRPKATRR